MTTTDTAPVTARARTATPVARLLATCRLLLAAVFLWPPLDKAFGLGYATPGDAGWLTTGKSPTSGYLGHIDGPLGGFFAGLANPVSDVLFMAGMAGTGIALLLGIGLRLAAAAGGLIMLMLWLSAWNFAPGSNNPLVDTHLVYAALLATLAATRAGDTWGFGSAWAASGIPGARTWLR
ncbi:hypothetical protein GCM10028784_00050 [Myceligenerans cantabricum]